jgi:1,4-dihydroxy-2-naphthoate octaprenyltransferase
VGFLYNGGRHPISHTPFGELFAGGFLGSLLFLLTYFVEAGPPRGGAWLASLPLLLLVASILTVNNTCDIEGDRAAGRRTLSIALGRGGGEALVYLLGGAAYAVTAVEIIVGTLPLLAGAPLAVSLGLAAVDYRAMHRGGFSHETKGRCVRAITRVLAFYGIALALSLGLALALRAP